MTDETLTVIVRGRNLEPLRKALADGSIRSLNIRDKQMFTAPPAEEPFIESFALAPLGEPA